MKVIPTKLSVPRPPSLDQTRLADPVYTVRGMAPGSGVLVHYDPLRACGGVCFLAAEMWAIWGPMPFGAFVAALGGRDIQIPDSDELARWVLACTSVPGEATH